jgi:hypothetical protein
MDCTLRGDVARRIFVGVHRAPVLFAFSLHSLRSNAEPLRFLRWQCPRFEHICDVQAAS